MLITYYLLSDPNQKVAARPNPPCEPIYPQLNTEDEAYYSCNGVGIYLVAQKIKQSTATASVWQGSDVICIDAVVSIT